MLGNPLLILSIVASPNCLTEILFRDLEPNSVAQASAGNLLPPVCDYRLCSRVPCIYV